MTAITIADLNNAKTDVDHIADIATSVELTATDRLGHVKDTISGAVYKITAFTDRGAWAAVTAYAVKDLVSNGGTWYVCVVAHTSSAAFATDTASKWRVYQGITVPELAASPGASLVGYMPAGTGAVATDMQSKNRESVSVFDFLTATQKAAVVAGTFDASIDARIVVALAAAKVLKKHARLNAGSWLTATPIALLAEDSLIGDGRENTSIIYSGTGSAIVGTGWTGKVNGLSVLVTNAAANGIEAGTSSRKPIIEEVYLDATAVGATTTGAGIYLNAQAGFSGGITIRDVYALQFKYGVKMVGTNLSTGTWTTVEMYNVWLLGRSAGIVAGSCGIYMDALTNGIGTLMMGGTIESFAVGIKTEDGSYGGVFETDMEANTVSYEVGNTFNGRIVGAFGIPALTRSANTPTQVWYQTQALTGLGPIGESYYSDSKVITDTVTGGQQLASKIYLNESLIEGNPVAAHGLKFQIGIGQSPTNGIDAHPSNHFIQLADRKMSWGPESPENRAGAQIVAWKVGDICYNSSTNALFTGWRCDVAGTPGTWHKFGVRYGVNTGGNADLALSVNGYYQTTVFATTLTADRTVTLSTTGAEIGDKFRITRPAAGAFNLNVGTGPLKVLPASSWCDVEYNGSAWVLTAYGAL